MDFKKQFEAYKTWIVENPKKAAEMESLVKWGSYFLAGRLQNSALLCEIVYAASRLFELFNHYIVCRKRPHLSLEEFNRLTVLLTVLEYVEVLVEVSAAQMWGEKGRWAVVSVIQLMKAIWRLILLLKKKTSFISSPPIKPIDRLEMKDGPELNGALPNGNIEHKGVTCLERSGRIMRTLEGTPPAHLRTFSPPRVDEYIIRHMKMSRQNVPFNHLSAEMLHIFRPLGHLSSMYLFGVQSWVPWCIAFGIDLTSIQLHSQSVLTREEKEELVRRRLSLLYYLIRTPAFHAVTHKRIRQFLIAAGNSIPMARFICQPLLEYIPEWQKIYSYTWS
ncbi:UNVERIFIED_CONTAM: hypothetical protein RMT77_008207 [Armadillidium vulgare]|nr:Peroxisomal membrane protein PEX16 [Armadillidium vulgare]